MTDTIGILGLGLVGMAVARRLRAAGHRVLGHDIDPARAASLAEAGGTPVSAEAVWQAPIVLSAVFDTDQLAAVVEGAAVQQDRVLVSMSTCDPDRMAAIGAAAFAKGIALVEAPVSGTSREVEQGTALILLAGEAQALDRFEAIADPISTLRRRVGGLGDGNRMKLAINLVLGLNRAAMAEGIVFAGAVGLDPATFLDVARVSAAQSAVMATKGPKMTARDFAPQGRIAQSRKDFRLIRDIAGRHGVTALPFAGRYLDAMEDCVARGEEDLDNAAILLAVERLARR